MRVFDEEMLFKLLWPLVVCSNVKTTRESMGFIGTYKSNVTIIIEIKSETSSKESVE